MFICGTLMLTYNMLLFFAKYLSYEQISIFTANSNVSGWGLVDPGTTGARAPPDPMLTHLNLQWEWRFVKRQDIEQSSWSSFLKIDRTGSDFGLHPKVWADVTCNPTIILSLAPHAYYMVLFLLHCLCQYFCNLETVMADCFLSPIQVRRNNV